MGLSQGAVDLLQGLVLKANFIGSILQFYNLFLLVAEFYTFLVEIFCQ